MYKMIIADCSPSVQKACEMAFSLPDFEIHRFEDGLSVLESLSQINPDAILLSLSLPARDGYDVGHCLRSQEQFKKTALFFLRGAFEPLDQEKIASLNFDGIVQKPFDSEKLAQMVKETIDRKRDPLTFPEEPLPDETSPRDLKASPPSPLFSEWMERVEEKVRELVGKEILEVERELEKRIKAQISLEFKRWIEEELKR